MDDAELAELWANLELGEVLFEGEVLKRSEVLGRWNPRHVRIVRASRDAIICLYWLSREDARAKPQTPRGILDATQALLGNDPASLQLEIRHVQDLERDHDCFGSRLDLVVTLRVATLDKFEALCGALGGAVAESLPHAVSSATTYERERKPTRPQLFDGAAGDSRLEDEYNLLGELGKGAFSVVYRARRKSAGREEVAVKIVMLGKLSARERKTQLRYLNSELQVLKKVSERLAKNPNMVHLIESFSDPRPSYRVSLVMELCTGGELFDRIIKRNFFSERDAKYLIRSLALALAELHRVGIVHRDLKPENLIYDTPREDATLKITDFGLALDMDYADSDVYKSHVVGTVGYFAPEVMSLRYSPACDVWSLGVILYILLCGYPPFAGRTRMEVQKETRLGRYQFHMPEWANISLQAQDLISKMLEFRPRLRIRPEQILEHPWLNTVHDADDSPIDLNEHKRFNHRRKLKAAALAVMWGNRLSIRRKDRMAQLAQRLKPGGFSAADLAMIKTAFEGVAGSEKGSVTDVEQLRNVMSDLGFREMPLERLFQLFDENGDGQIDHTELLSGLAALQGPGKEALSFAFSLYDHDGSGKIDKDELGQILAVSIANNPHLDPDKISTELVEAFETVDSNGNGSITFPEFQTVCEKRPYLLSSLFSRKFSSCTNMDVGGDSHAESRSASSDEGKTQSAN